MKDWFTQLWNEFKTASPKQQISLIASIFTLLGISLAVLITPAFIGNIFENSTKIVNTLIGIFWLLVGTFFYIYIFSLFQFLAKGILSKNSFGKFLYPLGVVIYLCLGLMIFFSEGIFAIRNFIIKPWIE